MNNIIDFPKHHSVGDEELFDQASLWIAKLSCGLTEEETQQLKVWLSEESHRTLFFKMAEVWDKMDDLNRLADLFQVPSENSELLQTPRGYFRRVSTYALSAAATILAFIAVFYFVGHDYTQGDRVFQETFITAKGQALTYDLSDGSRLVLNTNGKVHVKYSNLQRLFVLERGEMNIQVAHDLTRPLNVVAGNKVVQAIGTVFNVQIHENNEVELIVTEGKVRVEEVSTESIEKPVGRLPVTALTLVRGEKVMLGSQRETIIQMEEADIAVDLGWKQGNLIFRGETLEQALSEVTRYTDIEFEILDNDIRGKQIAGLFKIGDIEGLLSTLNKNFQIQSERVDARTVKLKAL